MRIVGDLADRLAGVATDDLAQYFLVALDLIGLDLDVLGGALGTSPRLVNHDARVRQRVTLAFSTGQWLNQRQIPNFLSDTASVLQT